MLFITYWELNENSAVSSNLEAANKLTASGMFPPPNVQILRWDITPDNWGILLVEADSVQAINDALTMWRAAVPGFFKITKTAPVLPVQEAIPATVKILEALNAG
jgi:hypothetical protein